MTLTELLENLDNYSEAQQTAIRLAGDNLELLKEIVGEEITDEGEDR